MRYTFLLFLTTLIFFQCSPIKNACIDITSIEQKHEKPSKNLIKNNRPNQRKEKSSLISKSQLKALGVVPKNLLNDTLLPEDLKEVEQLVSLKPHNHPKKKVIERLAVLKQYLNEHYLGTDTTLTEDEILVDSFDEQHKKAKKQAIISLALIGTYIIPLLGLLGMIASIILGIQSLKSYRKSINKEGRGFAIASLIINGVFIAAAILLVAFVIILFSNWESDF